MIGQVVRLWESKGKIQYEPDLLIFGPLLASCSYSTIPRILYQVHALAPALRPQV